MFKVSEDMVFVFVLVCLFLYVCYMVYSVWSYKRYVSREVSSVKAGDVLYRVYESDDPFMSPLYFQIIILEVRGKYAKYRHEDTGLVDSGLIEDLLFLYGYQRRV